MAKVQRLTPVLRRFIRERAEGRCEYCRSSDNYSTEFFAGEHIHPTAKGGTNHITNLAYACSGCNGHKGTKIQAVDLLTGDLVGLFHPRRQRWRDHFDWNENKTQIIGLTAVGRATIEALHLNRPALINLRRVLYVVGEHPPVDPD